MRKVSRSTVIFAFLSVVALVASGVALAQASGSEISACVHRKSGLVRIVDGGDCRPAEYPLIWNQEGPTGPPGPQSLDIVVRQAQGTFTLEPGNPDGSQGPTVSCAEGEVAISGGVIGFGPAEAQAELVGFGPVGNGWGFGWLNPGDEPITISPTVVALCVHGTRVNG